MTSEMVWMPARALASADESEKWLQQPKATAPYDARKRPRKPYAQARWKRE